MNERIAKLYDQAIVIEDGVDYVTGELDPKKFAKLIVLECADLFEVEWGSSMLQGTTAAHYLKQHFGVEDTEKAMQEVQRLGEEIQPDMAYSAEYDALYYIDTGEWVEPCCGDKDCRFCIHRPKKMEAKKEWVSLTYKELIHLAFGKTDLEEFYWAIDAALKERNDMKAERVDKTEKERHDKR